MTAYYITLHHLDLLASQKICNISKKSSKIVWFLGFMISVSEKINLNLTQNLVYDYSETL